MKNDSYNGSNEYAVVVGGVNFDICGTPHKPLIARDSNPGRINMSIGGVGRNIAHNLRLLGVNVKLITALGADAEAKQAAESCAALGIDISGSLIVKDASTSKYVFITDEKGDMQLAVNDMSIYENITGAFLQSRLDIINGASACIADANITKESFEYLAGHCTAPLFVDPVSVAKSYKISNVIGKLHTLKPNIMETEALTGIRITDEDTLKAAVNKLISFGLKRVFITMGSDGVFFADKEQCGMLPCMPGDMVNTTGAGDSFTAAVVWAYLSGLSLRDAAKAGLAAAAICLESAEAVNKSLSRKAVISKSGISI